MYSAAVACYHTFLGKGYIHDYIMYTFEKHISSEIIEELICTVWDVVHANSLRPLLNRYNRLIKLKKILPIDHELDPPTWDTIDSL